MFIARKITRLETLIFGHRPLLLGAFVALTLVMLYFASQLRIDAGFEKLLE